MKKNHYEVLDIPSNKEIKGETIEKKNVSEKTKKEIINEKKNFFHDFSQRYWSQKPKIGEAEQKKAEQERFLAEVEDLDYNTPSDPQMLVHSQLCSITKGELEQLEENDPGYVNGNVLDYDNDLGREENTYQKTGLHEGAIRWGDYAAKESKEYISLESGKILGRWGDEEGMFMADPQTKYEELELPVVEEKNLLNLYKVQKPFPAEISRIAGQPWNEMKKDDGRSAEQAVQYRMPIPVSELVKEGYLKKLTEEI